LAQIEMYGRGFADLPELQKPHNIQIEVLPKQLDEEVARCMVEGFGGVITKLADKQADYIGVPVNGPFKPAAYKY
ncbi:MAG TPA: adenosylhomocysteinase, partial [Gammaproteobacteria bacterium]|nr:adenosylhomocysteinase [Gammaproteobacteria bacterium]